MIVRMMYKKIFIEAFYPRILPGHVNPITQLSSHNYHRANTIAQASSRNTEVAPVDIRTYLCISHERRDYS